MRAIRFLFAFILLSSIFCKSSFAALYINEFSSGTTSDWVEIYNSDTNSVDLSLYILRDSTVTNKLDLSGSIGANGFATFEWSNRLNNPGDTIKLLLSADESVIDQVVYGEGGLQAPQDTQTAGRNPDGSSNVVLLSFSTKGVSNNTATSVPTATLTPTNSPTSTNTPTPIKSPTPTPTIKLTSTPTPVIFANPTKTPTPKPTSVSSAPNSIITNTQVPQNINSDVLGSSTENFTPTMQEVKKDVMVASSNSNNLIGKVFIALGVIFLSLCGIVLFWSYKKSKEDNNEI